MINFQIRENISGSLVALEENKNIPFDIRRVYYIYDTKKDLVRGMHSHKALQQVLICVKGSCTVSLDDSLEKAEVVLDAPNKGLLVRSNVWREMYDFSPDCVLMVLADKHYDEADYIRDYQDFLRYIRDGK